MGIYGLSNLSVLSGILFILQIGAADRSSSYDSALSSSTNPRQHSQQHGAPAIYTATHLFNQKSQSSLSASDHIISEGKSLKTFENEKLKQLEDILSDIHQRKFSTAATPTDSLTELSRYTTAATSTSREHITETDLREKFGTTTNPDSLTKANSEFRTTTSAESLTEGNPKYFSATSSPESEFVTESPSISSSGLTTEHGEVLTISSATHHPSSVDLATETALKSRTTVALHSESITEVTAKTEASTFAPSAGDSVTIVDTTDSDVIQRDFRVHHESRTTESGVIKDQTFTIDEEIRDLPTTPSPIANFILPKGGLNLPNEKNNADNVDGIIEDDSINVSDKPAPATDAQIAVNIIGAMPDRSLTTPSLYQDSHDAYKENLASEESPVVTEDNRSETTTALNDVATVVSMTTDETTTPSSISTEADVQVVTEKTSEITGVETIQEKQSGFFRCTDGTLIDIVSLCDMKADCPDYSDEDSCNADEKANLTEQIHRPSMNWDEIEVAPAGSRDETLISLDDSHSVGVIEMDQSKTEAPTTFRCTEGGNIIPISAVCDKRADCLDYSDEYDCSGDKHVTEATTTAETETNSWTANPNFEKSPAIEVIDEDEEEKEVYRCQDGSAVIPMSAVCDKKWDCLDFSDEDECDSHGKLAMEKPNKTKPGMSWATSQKPEALPDREQNMIIEEIADAKGALPEYWHCENGNYIYITSVCDLKDDCGDFSDEDDCSGKRKIPTTEPPKADDIVTTLPPASNLSDSVTLATTPFMSTTVQSTPASLTLFQIDDVKSWSQGVTPAMAIMEENFPVAMFQCDDGQEIEAMKVCDRNVDCFDGSDEDDCYDGWEEDSKMRFAREVGSGTGPTPVVCGTGFFQCIDSTCIEEILTCNGISNCLQGEDEDRTTVCVDACEFPTLSDRVILATGTPSQSLYLNGTTLSLDCILGSSLSGSADITCEAGSFSASPVCLRSCHIDLNRNALSCSTEMYADGSNTNCTCDSGYNLEVANTDITCSDSLFLPSHPQCEETNECMLNPTPCDPLANCFNMPLGSFTCICPGGYSGDGLTCTDIDECTLGTDLCDADATCTNTDGSYTCACNTGFLGDGFLCIDQIYYDFGTAAGDTSIEATPGSSSVDGYSVSGPLERRRLIPVGDQLFRYVHITNSGVIAFSNTLTVDLSEFSHPTTFTTNSSGMPAVAVFGIEARTSTADSSVYYQIYEDTSTDTFTTDVLANVSTQVNDAFFSASTTSSQYTPKWAMVITWDLLRRFGTTSLSTETNTFQAVLTTDGSKTYIIQLYQEASMLWDAAQLTSTEVPVIGNRIANSFFDLQSSESYSRDQMFRPDALLGNIITTTTTTGRRRRNTATFNNGQFVFRLDENADGFVNPAEYCQDWYDSTTSLPTDVPGLLPCPCTRLQAMNDRRFRACVPYSPLNQFAFGSDIDAYPSFLENSDQCLQQVFPSATFSGSRCIYNRSESLVVGYDSMWESSHLQSILADTSSLSFFYLSWIFNDVLPRHYCCSQSTDSYFCGLYEERRPPRTCRGYTPVGQGWGQGDPHITTLDKFEFTFNGLGEYLLIAIDSSGFQLQGRTERAFNKSGFEVNTGTVFTSFVASQGATQVQFDLNADRTNLTILINGTFMIDPVDLQMTEYNSSDPLFNIRYDSIGSSGTGYRYIATWREGGNSSNDVSVNVGNNLRMLDFTFQAPEAYLGMTRGLYGVWDNDITNDVTQPDGTVLADPMSLTEEELFNYGTLWRVASTDSLFTYQSPDVWDTYNMNSFQPMFLSNLNETADPAFRAAVMQNCSGDTSCLFDALATQDISIGTNTMMVGMARIQEVVELENYPPILSNVTEVNADAQYPGVDANGFLTVIVGRSYMYQAAATDQNPGDVITYTLRGTLPANATIDPVTGIFTWTPANTNQVQIGIEASDGTVSRFLQLTVKVCDCANGGTCDFTSIMGGFNINNDKFAIAQCDCAMGWAGDFCTLDFDSCELNPCYPGVTCIDDPPPSEVARCAACPPSLTGNGFQCWDLDECAEEIDGCDQLCVNSVGSFSCECRAGYDLEPNLKDCIDINECDRDTDECDMNSMCINTAGSYNCECNAGYVQEADNRTCTDIDECTDLMPCDMNADCGNVVGSYTCTCRSGYQGDGRSCTDVNECFNPDLNDCSQFASCENTDGYFVCQCFVGYEGSGLNCTDRNECEEGVSQCSLDAACQNVPGSFMCSCDPGYVGDGNTCVDFDECAEPSTNNCHMNAECINSLGNYSCACNAGYSGDGVTCTDIDECTSGASVCDAAAMCTNSIGTYICSCNAGYNGDGFACTDIDECTQQIDNCDQMCVNAPGSYNCSCMPGFVLDSDGFTCNVAVGMACTPAENPCTGGGSCTNAAGLITCTCPRGYDLIGNTDCQDIDECTLSTDNCDPTVGECTNTPGGYTCSCQPGYMLGTDERTCSNINECETGSNNCSADATCEDLPGNYSCVCNAGYSGDGFTCDNINECDTSPCVPNSDCTDTVGSYMCTCSSGFVGDQILGCNDMNECIGMPCDRNGNCTNTPGSYSCSCLAGFTGNGFNCTDILECNDPNRCVANSECMELEGSYTCVCITGYRGDGTEDCVDIDECLEDATICHQQATCNNTLGSYTCTCNPGYEGNGENCTDIDECALGTIDCDVNSNCTNTEGSYTCFCMDGYFDETGGRASAGECLDVDECALGVDACDVNSVCMNNNGSYTCVCNSGYMSVSQTMCTDILECSQNPSPCNLGAFELCIEQEGGYECVCQASTFRVGGVCTMATTLFLIVEFVDIQGLVVEYHFNDVNNPNSQEGLANDTMAVLMASSDFTNILDVSIESMVLLTGGMVAEVVFRVDIPITSSVTENDLAVAFEAGLTGSRSDILDPDNRVYVQTQTGVDDNECKNSTICPSLSMCINSVGSYSCKCNEGYTFTDNSNTTCGDIDECAINVCSEFSNCTNSIGSFVCVCNEGFVGNGIICDDINECLTTDICGTNTACTNLPGNYSCACAVGYSGTPPTCTDIDECTLQTDNCTQICTNNDGSYDCSCNAGYQLDADGITCNDIDECVTANDCGSNSICNNTVGSYTCSCSAGYSGSPPGTLCQDVDECALNTDDCSQLCINTDGSYNCSCNAGYELDADGISCNDIDECTVANYCGSNAMCNNTVGSYLCTCDPGYMGSPPGSLCADFDECAANTDDCTQNCINTVGSYNCSCNAGYELDADGITCNDINECNVANDCGSNAMCNNTVGSYICTCDSGYMGSPPGSLCQDIDECTMQTDDCTQVCINTEGAFRCACNPGFELDADGFTCNVAPGMQCDPALDPCTGSGTCMNATGLITCVCDRGFELIGDTLCQDVDECANNTDNCDRSVGACINTEGGYNCSCSAGYMLAANERDCSDIDECTAMTDNCDATNGVCTNTVGSFNCSCVSGYMLDSDGITCVDIDECASDVNPCMLANEECINNVGSYQCVCGAGFVRTEGYCLTNSTISGSLTINLVNNRKAFFSDGLSDPTSTEYMNLADLVCGALLNVVDGAVNTSTPYPMSSCEITGFAPGELSEVIVSYVITIYGESMDQVANSTMMVMESGFSGDSLEFTAEDGTTIQLLNLFFDDAEECMNENTCSGVNEGCTELDPGFECYCMDTSVRFMGMCLYYTRLMGSFRFNRINGIAVTYTADLADRTSPAFVNMSDITCGVFMEQIDIWVNMSVPYLYIDCNITAFRPGSIIVDFQVDIYGESQMEAMMRAQLANDNGFQGSPSNWTGSNYTIYVDELIYDNLCEPTTCLNGATCNYDIATGTTSCSCAPGFDGPICDNKVACDGFTCQNGGECEVDLVGDPYCDCPPDWTGMFCESHTLCEDLECQNNSTCEVNDQGIAVCICPDGYEGDLCQFESSTGLSVGVIVGIVLGVVGFVLLIVLLCFCCLVVFAARRRRQRKRELLEGAENWGYGGRRYAPATAIPAVPTAPSAPGPSRGAVFRNDPGDFASESSDNFYYYQNTRGRPFGGASGAAPSARPMFNVEDEDDDDTIDSRFSGIIRNMWNMHAEQRPEATFDPRQLPAASNFMAGGIPRASVQPRNLYPEYQNTSGFERPYVADGTESNAYSEETEEFRPYRGGGRSREKSRSAMDAYNYF